MKNNRISGNLFHSLLGAVMLVLSATALPFSVSAADGTTVPSVVIEYGSKIVEIEDIADDMKSLGISVELKAGYENASCGRVTVNGKSVEFDQDSVDGGELGSFIHMQTLGKKIYDMHSCNVKN